LFLAEEEVEVERVEESDVTVVTLLCPLFVDLKLNPL
jgi:hypothetical protein